MTFTFDFLLNPKILAFVLSAILLVRLLKGSRNKISLLLFILGIFTLGILALNPLKESGGKKQLPGIVAIVTDYSPSMKVTNRLNEAQKVKADLTARLEKSGFIVKNASIGAGNTNDNLTKALFEAFKGENQNQIKGAFIISDGLLKTEELPKLEYPINQIIVGNSNEHDRFIKIIKPAIATEIGNNAEITFKIIDQQIAIGNADIEIQFDGEKLNKSVALNQDVTIQIPVLKSGKHEIAISTPIMANEISSVNNAIITDIEGIFDRLRVLLISGEPYEGLRSWRALLKSDPSIDLVHFTILRGPDKEDFTAQNEISLIPFPVEELFYEKLDSFDLIIIDRFMAQDVLRDEYLENINSFVQNGGALLAVLGPHDISNQGILGSKLNEIIPIERLPTLETNAFRPKIAQNAQNHPIVRGLEGAQSWGQWDTYFKTQANGEIILNANDDPLLIVNDVKKGRVATLLSENSWFWARNIDGGGPFRELIGRLVHYLLKDPQFEKQKIELNNGLDTLELVTNGIKGQVAINGPQFAENIEIMNDETQTNKVGSNIYGLYHSKFDELDDFAILGAHNETIGQSLAAMPLKSENIWGAILYSKVSNILNAPIKIYSKPPIVKNINEFAVLAPSFSKNSIEHSPLINRNLLLFLAITLFLLSWHFEGVSQFRNSKKPTD